MPWHRTPDRIPLHPASTGSPDARETSADGSERTPSLRRSAVSVTRDSGGHAKNARVIITSNNNNDRIERMRRVREYKAIAGVLHSAKLCVPAPFVASMAQDGKVYVKSRIYMCKISMRAGIQLSQVSPVTSSEFGINGSSQTTARSGVSIKVARSLSGLIAAERSRSAGQRAAIRAQDALRGSPLRGRRCILIARARFHA